MVSAKLAQLQREKIIYTDKITDKSQEREEVEGQTMN